MGQGSTAVHEGRSDNYANPSDYGSTCTQTWALVESRGGGLLVGDIIAVKLEFHSLSQVPVSVVQ